VPDYSPAQYPVYAGSDLGLTIDARTGAGTLRVWAPTASSLRLRLYAAGSGGAPRATHALTCGPQGTWLLRLPPGTSGFYTVQATIGGRTMAEVCEPYARAVGVNCRRAAWLDPASAAPAGWAQDRRPPLAHPTDALIGEVSVRDLSAAASSGSQHRGHYLAFTESGTTGPGGVSTGVQHARDLGVTHLHLLPVNDFAAIDESRPPSPDRYSWGYDPLNYFVPEGSYATDAQNPAVRIREYKALVQSLHQQNLGVIADVVFNHVADAGTSAFEQLVPGYYFRHNPDGSLSNATACGNEVASERPMVRKLIVDCVGHWARHYHVDGFRFDLMGVLDLETMRAVRQALNAVSPQLLVYGEGWAAGASPLPEAQRAVKANLPQLPGIAAFGDELRDGVKGHYARQAEGGFVGGQPGLEESVKFGIVGAGQHPQLDYQKVNYSKAPWATQPGQALNYVACHDDRVLWDKLRVAHPTATEQELTQMDALSNTIVFTAQGIPFLPLGDEFLRTKKGASNSYNLPDSINELDWALKARNRAVFAFYQQLLALRKAHPAFRLRTQAEVARHLVFLPGAPAGTIAYQLREHAGGDAWQTITLVFNGLRQPATVPLPAGRYQVALRGLAVDLQAKEALGVDAAGLSVPACSALILKQ
jgi:pullulanase